MAEEIGALAVKIGIDNSGFQSGVTQINKSLKVLDSEFKLNTASLGANGKSLDGLRLKSETLAKSMDLQKQKVSALETAYKKSVETKGKDAKATQDLEIKLNLARVGLINMGNELTRTNVQIATQTNGLTKLGEGLKKTGTSMNTVGDGFKNAGTNIAKAGAVIGTAFTAIGAGSIKAYDEVKTGTNEIARLTGATGQKFKDLKKVYEDTARESANSFEEIGTAVGSVSVRLNLTGDALKVASLDFMKFAKVSKVDVATSVTLVSRAMGDAGIKSTEYKNVLDLLTISSQKSGIKVDVLAESLAKYGAPMRALGFDTKESIALFSGWEKAGVNTELAFGGMKKAIGNWGKEGKDSAVEFKKLLKDIEKAPTLAEATSMAIEAFGQKAGADLADAIKGGRFEYEDFLKTIENSKGTLDATAKNMTSNTAIMKKAWHSVTLASAELGESMSKELAPIMLKFADTIKGLTKWWDGLSETTKANIAKFGLLTIGISGLTASLGVVVIGIGGVIKSMATIHIASGALAVRLGLVSVANASVGVSAVVATPPVVGLGSALWLILEPVMPLVLALGALAFIVGGVALSHKKQAEEVRKTEEAYKKFNETLSGGSTKDLKAYQKEIEDHQKKLIELRKKLEESTKALENPNSNLMTDASAQAYNKRKDDLNAEIALINKKGFTIDKNGKIIEAVALKERLSTVSQLEAITSNIQKRVDEGTKIIQLMDRYIELNNVKNRTKVQDAELSNSAKELGREYGDLDISIDKNGNAIISNLGLMAKKKTALEIETQNIKENAYQQAKTAIYSEQIEIGKTKTTIEEVQKRMKARDEEAQASINSAQTMAGAMTVKSGFERQSAQAQAESSAYLDAYLRLKAIKSQISSISLPSASGGGGNIPSSSGSDSGSSSDKGSNAKEKKEKESYETGIEATSKYSKVLVDLEQNLKKVDTKIEGIQNKINTSKAIGTVAELAKATKEQNNLYQAQIEKINTLKSSEKILNDNKQKLIREFKASYSTLKNVDMTKWEEDDFNNFIERTYKQSATTDKVRAEALKKGQKYAQNAVKDLVSLNNKIESVGDSLIDVKMSQLQALKEIEEKEKVVTEKIIGDVDKLSDEIQNSLKTRYEKQQKLEEDNLSTEIDNLNKWKEESETRINSVYDTKIKGIEDSSNAQIKALNAEIDALDEKAKAQTRAEADATALKTIVGLQSAIANEHNEYNKAELQKQLNKEVLDRLKTLSAQATEDKKAGLSAQILLVKENVEKQKVEFESLKKAELANIAYIFTAETNNYNQRAINLKIFYEAKLADSAIEAEAEKLIMDNNQVEIIALLNSYSEQYRNAGQTLGEKLVEGFKPQIDAMQTMINNIISQMSALNGGQRVSSASVSGNSSTNNTSNTTSNKTVTTTVNITSPVAQTPSQQRVAMETTLRKLAFTS